MRSSNMRWSESYLFSNIFDNVVCTLLLEAYQFIFVFFYYFFSRKGLMLQFTNLLSIPWIWLISISHEWCCNLSDLEMEYVEWHLKITMAGNSVQLFLTVMLLIMMNHYYSILSSYVTILVSQNILKQFLIFLFIT